jgi:HPt (histidine-containing phosphotransfer) domain-containing protein
MGMTVTFGVVSSWYVIMMRRRLPQTTATVTANTPSPNAESTAFPDLPGIDVADGLRRVAGNAALYRRLLQRFVADQATTAADIEQALAAHNQPLAERLTHTVKGVAGNIGAMALHQAAKQLETVIKANDDEARPRLLAAFTAELQQVVAALAVIMPDKAAEADNAPVRKPRAVQPRLLKLYDLLVDNDGETLSYLDDIREALAGAFAPAALAQFEEAVNQFDFDHALELLRRIAADAQIDLPRKKNDDG